MERVAYEVTIDGKRVDLVHVLYQRKLCNPEILIKEIRKQGFPMKSGAK